MPLIPLAKTDFGSLTENLPRQKLSNLYMVENPLSVSGVSYISRPSLSTLTTLPEGPIRGLFYQAGNGATTLYVVAGNNLYTVTETGAYTLVGSTPGSDFCTFASTIYGIAVVSDGGLYIYDGTTVTSVTIPDSGKVSDVTSLDNYFIVGIKNTNKFYWIEPGASVIDPLNFASAERNPDDIVTMISIGDELWAIGQNTVEIFTDSGDAAAPFVRIPGRVYQVGCADKHSVSKTNKDTLPCLIWVTPTKEVVLAQGIPEKISNESIEELLRASETFTGWSFRTNRHNFYVLTTDNETIVYDITAGSWSRWSSYQSEKWKAFSGIQVNSTTYAVNKEGSDLFYLTSNVTDSSSDFIICEVSGFVPNPTNNSVVCNAVTLFLNYGASPSYTEGPLAEMRFSDSFGNSWSSYYQGRLGNKGMYDTTVRYRSMGSFNRPGRYFEFRFSNLASIRFDGATMNDSL